MFTAHISAAANMFIGSDEEDEVAATSILIIFPQTKVVIPTQKFVLTNNLQSATLKFNNPQSQNLKNVRSHG
jgi:hypothetical protein